ncbi:DUF29 domain-containing protein [Duganella sp. BJB1802]|uniref:DUF29 domain-containing protein n=1 Tax=Duganella sp. BJB1802 TaxID=2744575 RepID=UPI0015930F26|nr:DUF29 domain-containing protein [Duganella sp. BJB1802]NVD72540.1 DUF29 domain-containing protein [Duganella sp. BJB1802]
MHTYDEDLALWMDAQIQLLLEHRFAELDVDNLVAELDGMKKQYEHELDSRLTVLIMHLLKCQYQKDYPQNKWRSTLIEQRYRLSRLLKTSPSTRKLVPKYATECYPIARRRAAEETGLGEDVFPHSLPYSIEQLMDQAFMP